MKSFQSFFCGEFPNSFIYCKEKKLSYRKLFQNANKLAKSLSAHSIEFQTKIVLISQPSIEWILCDLACLNAGIITVPLFPNSSSDSLLFQIENVKPDFLIAENEEVLKQVCNATSYSFKNVFLMNKGEGSQYKTIDDLIKEAQDGESNDIFTEVNQSLPATIIHTSGASGNPKGVVLTYSNFAYQVNDIQTSYPEINHTDIAMSILPMAHVYQRTITYFYLSKGVGIHIVNDVGNAVRYLNTIQPSLITVVPRVLEKVYSRARQQIEKKPVILRDILLTIFKKSSENVIHNKLICLVCNVILFKKVRRVFGKNIKYIVSGGAKLNSHEETFFYNVGICVLQGYGMTESSPVIASNIYKNRKLYTVGKPLSSVEVKIEDNNEICIRGESIFGGYYGKEVRNTEDFFHTGDCGFIDYDGFLTVTGRIKEQFKTANGKFVNPIKTEALLNAIDGIENSCVIAEGRKFVTAIVFSQEHNVDSLQAKIDDVNLHLEHHEQIQYFYISLILPTVENNMITPSLKIKRSCIEKTFFNEIEEMYKKIKNT